MTEYCYLLVAIWPVYGDDQKQRGWRTNGISVGVSQAMASGDVVFHELAAREEASEYYWHPGWEFRQAFLALLNRLAAEGWTVVDFTPADKKSDTDVRLYMGRRDWPLGDFLLVRES